MPSCHFKWSLPEAEFGLMNHDGIYWTNPTNRPKVPIVPSYPTTQTAEFYRSHYLPEQEELQL